MSSVVVIGDALIDELRDDTGVREFVGGAALNVAVGLARLGVPTSLVAMVGDDAAGAMIRSYLDDFGVALLPSPSPLGSSRAVSIRSASGEPSYVFNDAAQARRLTFDAAQRAAIADAGYVVISCYPFDDDEQTDLLADALAAASGVIIDPNPRSGMMSDRDRFREGFERIAAGSTLVKVGDDDADLLYGVPLDEVAARLRAHRVETVLATRGSQGATVMADAATVTRPISSLPGQVVDTMGAGDASLAATVAALVQTDPTTADEWSAVLQRAMDVAAATCRHEGALLRVPEASDEMDLDRLGT